MVRIQITNSEINETLVNVPNKPVAYNGQAFPLTDLNDRVFEILTYQIFKSRIETNDYTLGANYDAIHLMQGVGERGRDCFLTKKGKNNGIIQCKQISKNITKPEFLKEILKFVLHYVLDKTLISNLNRFTYYFVVSKGFAETTVNLAANFKESYKKEDIESYCEELFNKYIIFKSLQFDDIEKEIFKVLDAIKIKLIQPSDLNQYLFEHDKIIKSFFRVLTVTDNTLLEGIIDNYLSPILNKLYAKKDRKHIDFSFRFKEYLQRAYNYYSSSKTLVFGNQQKKLEDFYYPLNLECLIDNHKHDTFKTSTLKYEDDFIPKFKKVIIVDNGGMGKSTIMKWLFLSVIKQRKGIPIFIELRKLKERKSIIDEIISELNPIDETFEKDVIQKLIAQGNFIFFFDGYDEIAEEDKEFVTTDLQNFISKSVNNLFIMTSRPETALNTFSDFKEFKVKKLLKTEAFELIKKIGNNSDKSLRLIKKLEEDNIQNIDDFLQSPLLVSLLYKKFEHRENIPLHLQEFYYDVFEALFQDHDLTKGDSFTRDKKTKLAFTEFFQVLRELGFYTFKKGEVDYNDAVLTKYLQEISKRLPNIKFKPFDFIDDLVKAVPLFSKEGLQYRWSHKSFQEYFVAEFICRDAKERQVDILNKMYNSDKFEKFAFVFSLCYDIDYKPFREAVLVPYVESFITYFDDTFLGIDLNFEVNIAQLEIRKAITFNKSYLLIIDNGKRNFDVVIKALNSDDPNLEDYPSFISPNFKIRLVSFAEITTLLSQKINDLLEFLYKKKSNLLKQIKYSKNGDLKDELEKMFMGNMPKYLVINHTVNDSISNNEILEKLNKFIVTDFTRSSEFYLDIKKCRKFINDYNKEILIENDDYFLGSF